MRKTDDPNLAAYVIWVPRNGAKEEHVERVTGLVTDERATHYWDGAHALIEPYAEMLELTGPCAGMFMIFEPGARWPERGVPRPDYVEDAHAKEFNRPWPHLDAKRFASKVIEALEAN